LEEWKGKGADLPGWAGELARKTDELPAAESGKLDLGYANLERADLRGAVLGGDYGGDLRLYKTILASGQYFLPSMFKGANLEGANLKRLV
jgi:uncharacterized protein YjbI with pentapeptide repeats